MPLEKPERRILSVSDVVKPYLEHYAINHRENSFIFAKQRLAEVSVMVGIGLFHARLVQ